MIINRHQIAKANTTKLQQGFSAFTDSKEVARLMKREFQKRHLTFVEEETSLGSWFFPSN